MVRRIVIPFLVLALVATNAYWFYVAVDAGVTNMYSDASLFTSRKVAEQAIVLANLGLVGETAERAVEAIGLDVYGLEPFEKEGCIYAGGICLVLDAERRVNAIRMP